MKNLYFIVALLFLPMTSCMKEDYVKTDANVDEIDNSEWLKIRDHSMDIITEAHNEFFKGIPSAYDKMTLKPKSIEQMLVELPMPEVAFEDKISDEVVYTDEVVFEDMPVEEFLVKEKIQALALEAVATSDDRELVTYLKEVNLYDRTLEVAERYDLEQVEKSLRENKKAVSYDRFLDPAFLEGDVFLLRGTNKIFNLLIPGYWGHAGFLDNNKRSVNKNYFLLSASNETDNHSGTSYVNGKLIVGRVGYDKIRGYWDQAVHVNVSRVKYASDAQRQNSINYARGFYGRPYSIKTSREDNNTFYCSKIVYRGWLSQGYELEPQDWYWYWEPYWTYKRVLGIKIWYVAFRKKYVRDPWVTPSDLRATRNTYDVTQF